MIHHQSTLNWKSNWFVKSTLKYKQHIYEDIFIRKYVTSFFFKWSKFFIYKVLGSIYLFRTFGKTYINVTFFYPRLLKQKKIFLKRKNRLRQPYVCKIAVPKPVNKYKKHLTALLFFYQLEKILGTQVLFKFKNICIGFLNTSLTTVLMTKLYHYFLNKFSQFKYQFKGEIYLYTIMFFLNFFKFKNPDGTLLANYIASILPSVQKHTQFLLFVKRILQILQKVFRFSGVKILLSGKLNGLSRAQTKHTQIGCVSLQSIKMSYTSGYSQAFTTAGKIGVKVWIC